MKYGSYDRESRSEMRGKRRRTNLILNMLIGLVLILIIIVSSIIFLGGNDDETADKKLDNQTEHEQDSTADNDKDNDEDKSIVDDEEEKETASNKEEEQGEEGQSEKSDEQKPTEKNITPADKEDEVVTTGGENNNVKRTIENPSWQPIGTSQVGEHTSVFDKDSVDWAEMIQAITYATGVEESNMTIWFIGNNGHNRAVGTISSKDQQEKYRVFIDWVDGQGWKPTKVEELIEIDKKSE